MMEKDGAVRTAHVLLKVRDRFTYGFKRLAEAELLGLSLEHHVVLFADTDLFSEDEILAAKWRLDNADKATDGA